ncbi:MAG TPA: hypothetical protein VJ804_15750 [Acidimicrobiales bacterium]|nr:hypothetical protein [Acidimicrobiales bacterium]
MHEDLHEWVSFEDPEEERTWVFDLTYLTSPWRCIYGQGCQGVLTGPAEDLEQGCCSYGAHFVDEEDEASTLAYAARLTAEQWEKMPLARRKGGATKTNKDGERKTRVVDGACIFLNSPDFPGGMGCALHHGALQAGERPLDWKPDVCWQLPLRLEEHTDDHGHVTSTLREWKRRDWGAGGQEFHWWCTEGPEAFVDHRPVYETSRDEIVEMVGEVAYGLLVDHLKDRGTEQLLPHPALRARR